MEISKDYNTVFAVALTIVIEMFIITIYFIH